MIDCSSGWRWPGHSLTTYYINLSCLKCLLTTHTTLYTFTPPPTHTAGTHTHTHTLMYLLPVIRTWQVTVFIVSLSTREDLYPFVRLFGWSDGAGFRGGECVTAASGFLRRSAHVNPESWHENNASDDQREGPIHPLAVLYAAWWCWVTFSISPTYATLTSDKIQHRQTDRQTDGRTDSRQCSMLSFDDEYQFSLWHLSTIVFSCTCLYQRWEKTRFLQEKLNIFRFFKILFLESTLGDL